MNHLFVWVRHPDNSLSLTGELAASEPIPGGRFESEFEYSPQWLRHPAAFALDPVSLPLDPSGRRFRAEMFHPPLAVFDDALPDDWGRRLLTVALKLEGRKPSPAEMLLYMRGGGTGALLFTDSSAPPRIAATSQSQSLSALLSAAGKFEAGTLPHDGEFRRLLEGSSRAGGARPKALVHDAEGEWIAKFPSRTRDGSSDVVGLEATCLAVAERAGLQVPESRLQVIGRGRVLLVKRFDVTEVGGRVHMVSMRTLCKERAGLYATSYSQLAEVLGKYSVSPAADVAALFRHLVFNAAVGNVDDHLKNFWMLASPKGYRFAPAFDLLPDVTGRGEHTLAFREGMFCPTHADLVKLGAAWSVADAADVIGQVAGAVDRFVATARKFRVRTGGSFEAVRADIRRRLNLIARN